MLALRFLLLKVIESTKSISEWSVMYPYSKGYRPGQYTVEVDVAKWYVVFYVFLTSQRYTFNVTGNTLHITIYTYLYIRILFLDLVNGHMSLQQNTTIRDDVYVSNVEPVMHSIVIDEADSQLLKDNATSVLTYWFIDCVFYGYTDDYSFNYKFSDAGKEHNVDALVVASYEKVHT